jgi:hypothetical protein
VYLRHATQSACAAQLHSALMLQCTRPSEVHGRGNATAAAAAAARPIGTAITTAMSTAQSQVVVQCELISIHPHEGLAFIF